MSICLQSQTKSLLLGTEVPLRIPTGLEQKTIEAGLNVTKILRYTACSLSRYGLSADVGLINVRKIFLKNVKNAFLSQIKNVCKPE